MTAVPGTITSLVAGERIIFGGDRFVEVPPALADTFRQGDRLVVVQADGALLHIPGAEHELVDEAVSRALRAFGELSRVTDEAVSDFFDRFATALADDATFAPIAEANAADVARARERGRSVTRLVLDDRMRSDMVSGLHGWRDTVAQRDAALFCVEHPGWNVEARRAPLGVVGFVFEGRPNVFADACGVLRSGNTVVFRIGSDALGTARAIVEHALEPALRRAGLPGGAVQLIESAEHSAGHALFSDHRLALAVARGSGAAVAQLGAVAQQSGVPVSLHGTGGAWMVAGVHADADDLAEAIRWSLDRKVCNTLNCLAIVRSRAGDLMTVAVAAIDAAAAARGNAARFHVVVGSEFALDPARFQTTVRVERAEGVAEEPAASSVPIEGLATEWEWETSPEVTLVVVDDIAEAVELFNRYSPHFVASLVSNDPIEHERFYASIDAPFVGNGFTRWVDGQYALDKPELGLSNWQHGRMLGRGGILSGDSVHTIRYRATVTDPSTHR